LKILLLVRPRKTDICVSVKILKKTRYTRLAKLFIFKVDGGSNFQSIDFFYFSRKLPCNMPFQIKRKKNGGHRHSKLRILISNSRGKWHFGAKLILTMKEKTLLDAFIWWKYPFLIHKIFWFFVIEWSKCFLER